MDEVRYEYQTIQMKILRWIGILISLGTVPVHTRIFWRRDGQCWMTELTSDPPTPQGADVGEGDGYTIQITKVDSLLGIPVPGADASKIDGLARQYASIEKGDLNSSYAERDFYDVPQGHGGPPYDRCTSNSYAAWILRNICQTMPARPTGGIGWEQIPEFPGPVKPCEQS